MIDDRFEDRVPSARNAFEIFKDQWSSNIPAFGLGIADLFNDSRLHYFDQEIGGFAGKRVIELGPLEGGHTYMMSLLGASEILSIEANKNAYLKCLVIKETFGINAKFFLGDFCKFLAESPPRVDVILASGVLYHMVDPLALIRSLTRSADAICVWTHYYDEAIIRPNENLCRKFNPVAETIEFEGRSIELCEQSYLSDPEWKGYAGGMEKNSFWITRTGIIEAFAACSFDVSVGPEHPNHPNGPAFTFVARRRR
jgi:hypothetical protein